MNLQRPNPSLTLAKLLLLLTLFILYTALAVAYTSPRVFGERHPESGQGYATTKPLFGWCLIIETAPTAKFVLFSGVEDDGSANCDF